MQTLKLDKLGRKTGFFFFLSSKKFYFVAKSGVFTEHVTLNFMQKKNESLILIYAICLQWTCRSSDALYLLPIFENEIVIAKKSVYSQHFPRDQKCIEFSIVATINATNIETSDKCPTEYYSANGTKSSTAVTTAIHCITIHEFIKKNKHSISIVIFK